MKPPCRDCPHRLTALFPPPPDKLTCALIIAILSRVKIASAFDICDIVRLARNPKICTVMLPRTQSRSYRIAMRRAPSGLTDSAKDILGCITYLEARRMVAVARNRGRMPVSPGELFAAAKTEYSENVSEIIDFSLSAFETVTRLREDLERKYADG